MIPSGSPTLVITASCCKLLSVHQRADCQTATGAMARCTFDVLEHGNKGEPPPARKPRRQQRKQRGGGESQPARSSRCTVRTMLAFCFFNLNHKHNMVETKLMPPPNCSTRCQKLRGIPDFPSERITDLEAAIRQMRQLSCILDSRKDPKTKTNSTLHLQKASRGASRGASSPFQGGFKGA